MNATYKIFPRPKKAEWNYSKSYKYYSDSQQVIFAKNDEIAAEGYTLTIDENGIQIGYSSAAGMFYAKKALQQIIAQAGDELPYARVEDEPDFSVRGLMIDIGRDKIPTMESLFRLIDIAADLKYNQLHLYMEGYCYEYKKYRGLFSDETPITAEEFKQLEEYCQTRFIELVPTQNCFGHMEAWLAQDEFKDLSVNPNGREIMPGIVMPCSTLDPLDERSYKLVNELLNELIPNFSSPSVNICFDEPFDLGLGKSEKACAERGKGQVYIEFLDKVCEIVRRHEKKPMAWGDIIAAHPETVPLLPKDLTVLDWNYEGGHPFEKNARRLHDNNIQFMLCPGTSSWSSIGGRLKNMKTNILDAAEQGHKYGAQGILVTDWGDMGHWQYQFVSYPGFVYGAGLLWNTENNREADVAEYLDKFVFKDSANKMGGLVLQLAEYSDYENIYLPNTTLTFCVLALLGLSTKEGMEKRVKEYLNMIEGLAGVQLNKNAAISYDISGLNTFLDKLETELAQTKMLCGDAELLKHEFLNTVRLIRHGARLIDYMLNENELSADDKKSGLEGMLSELAEIIEKYKEIWNNRNRAGGLNRSLGRMYRLQKQYEMALEKC